MNTDTQNHAALLALTAAFTLLAAAFACRGPGRPDVTAAASIPEYRLPSTVRLSAAQLLAAESDTSGMMCYACHDPKNPPPLKMDADGLFTVSSNHLDLVYARMNCAGCHPGEEGRELEWDSDDNLVIPPAHRQPPIRHGRFGRNNDCYTCHIPDQLDRLRTRQGQEFALTESNQLCGSCHGPAFRDWELGVHGRRNGYWHQGLGKQSRHECTSCHDPHSPSFPAVIPAPGPNHLHTIAGKKTSPARPISHE